MLVNAPRELFISFLVEHEKAHLTFEKEGRIFKNAEIEEVYANGKALVNIGILQLVNFDLTNTNEAVERLSKYFPTKKEYVDDAVELVAKKMDDAAGGSLWGKKTRVSSLDEFFFLQTKEGFPNNKKELREAISKDIARNIPQSVATAYWKKILKALPDDEKALLSNWAYYTNVKSYTSQYGEPSFDFNKEPYPELNKGDREKYTEWDSFISGIIGTFTGAGHDLWFANKLLTDVEGSVVDWYKKITPEKLDEHIKNLSKAMAFKSMVVASFEGGHSVSALDQSARKVESVKEAYYEIKQRTKIAPVSLMQTSDPLWDQHKDKILRKDPTYAFEDFQKLTDKEKQNLIDCL
jgi:hypothetical protein